MVVSAFRLRRTSLSRLVVILGALIGCASIQKPQSFHQSVLVVPGAEDIKPFDGYTSAVQYFVRTSEPDRLVAAINTHLEALEFSKVEFDIANPGNPSSHSRGWVDFIDRDGTRVRMWQGDWRRQDGAVVTYDLRYRLPKDGQQPRVQVSVMFQEK